MKLLVLNNLSSGLQDGGIYDFIRSFATRGDTVVLRCVDHTSSFAEALSDVTEFDAVVAAGGDGTVASVCYLSRNTGVPVLPYPSGTANLLAQNIASPIEPHALAKLVREGKHMNFDLGELSTQSCTFGFSMMAGCGYDAKVMGDAHRYKKLLGPAAYFKAAIENPNPQYSHITLTVDGTTYEHDGVGVILFNFSKIQFDISIGLENLPNDGALDLVVLRTHTAWNLLPPMLGAMLDHSGRALRQSDALVYYRGHHIEVDANPPLPVQYDGEAIEATTPLVARILPQATKLIISDEGFEEYVKSETLTR